MNGSEQGTIDYVVYIEQVSPHHGRETGNDQRTQFSHHWHYAPGTQGQPANSGTAHSRAMADARNMATRANVLRVHVHAIEHIDIDVIK